MSRKAIIRCGKLENNGKEDSTSVQAVEKANVSWGEAVLYAEKHIKMKLAKGYDFLGKPAQQSSSRVSFTLAVPTNDTLDLLSDHSRGSIARSETSHTSKRKPSDLPPQEDSKQTKRSNGQDTLEEDSLESVLKSLEAQEKFQAEQKSLGEFTQKVYKVENLKSDEKSIITEKAQSLELICEFDVSKVLVAGFQKRIDQFVDYLKRFLSQRKKTESEGNGNGGNSSKTKDDGRKEIPLSSQAAKFASYIEQKGLDLGLICEVHEKSVIALGDASKVAELEKYIKEKEKEALKSPQKPDKDESVKKEVPLTPSMKRMKAEIEKKSDQLNVFSEFTETKLVMLGPHSAIAELLGYLFELEASPSKEKPEKESDGDYTQKEIKLSKAITNHMPAIKKKAEELDLILDIEGEKFLVAGFEKKINELKKLIEEKEKEKPKTEDSNKALALSKGTGNGDYVQKEISISTFHRGRQEEIEKKAEEMELICDFGYDVVLITGPMSAIGMFIAYLYEVESQAKKALYPKYWDFHEVSAFSMAGIPQGSQEYQEIENLFFQTMRGHKILKLERIQNKYLMDHYVNNIQKRLELRPKDLNRMLLFHGTRATAPDTIYKNFDTGFDLQYAAHGMYGKGIYFAVAANYSHNGFVYRTKSNTFQLIVADVFVGKAKASTGGNFIKAPEGYDCICGANGGFYILYNNFHSYPLYLLEYK